MQKRKGTHMERKLHREGTTQNGGYIERGVHGQKKTRKRDHTQRELHREGTIRRVKLYGKERELHGEGLHGEEIT